MSSSRLPGKTLRRIGHTCLLGYLLESLDHCSLADSIIVATSSELSDNPIADFCSSGTTMCFRGSLADVAGRFLRAAESRGLESFVRISGDSPLLDHRLVDRVVGVFRSGAWDLATNVCPRTFPKGQSVEVVAVSAFRKAVSLMTEPDDREHVTRFFYRHPADFRIANVANAEDLSAVRLTVDTEQDFGVVSEIIARMTRPHWEYDLDQLVMLYRQVCGE